jgi:hypothetical protein
MYTPVCFLIYECKMDFFYATRILVIALEPRDRSNPYPTVKYALFDGLLPPKGLQ